jgi:hypothetical protein
MASMRNEKPRRQNTALFVTEARLNNAKEFSPYRKKTQHFTISQINLLMLFEKIIPVYSRIL